MLTRLTERGRSTGKVNHTIPLGLDSRLYEKDGAEHTSAHRFLPPERG